jgi:hypothetical protein
VSNDTCTNDNEIECEVIEEITESVRTEPEIQIPPQPIDRHETIEIAQPIPQPEATVEHVVHEVSFKQHKTQHTKIETNESF